MVRVARYLQQACYYWALDPAGPDSGGQPVYLEPEKIACRWDDTVEQFYTDAGELTVSKSKVLVDRDLKVNELLALSTSKDLEDWDDLLYPSDPWDDENPQAYVIRSFKRVPDRRGRIERGVRMAWL